MVYYTHIHDLSNNHFAHEIIARLERAKLSANELDKEITKLYNKYPSRQIIPNWIDSGKSIIATIKNCLRDGLILQGKNDLLSISTVGKDALRELDLIRSSSGGHTPRSRRYCYLSGNLF